MADETKELIRIFNEGQTSFLTLAVTPSTQAKEICAHATRKYKLEGDERFSLAVETGGENGTIFMALATFSVSLFTTK
jgi:hypothetical protein